MKRKIREQARECFRDLGQNCHSFLRRRFSYFVDSRRIYHVLPGFLRLRFWFIMLLQLARAAAESVTIFVIALLTQSVSSPDSVRATYLYRTIVPRLPEYVIYRLSGDRTLITTMCLFVVFFIVIKNIILYASRRHTGLFAEEINLFITRAAYSRFFDKDYLWHISPASKEMLDRIDKRGQLASLITSHLQMFGNIICAAVMFSMLCAVNLKLTVFVLSVFAVVGASSYIALRRKVERFGHEVGRIASAQAWATRMATRGMREVIIYRKQDAFLESIVEGVRGATPYKAFLSYSGSIPGWLLEVSGFIIIFGVMVHLVGGGVPMPEVIAAMSMLLLTAWRVLPLVSRSMGLAVHITGVRSRALECLELVETMGEPPDAVPQTDATPLELPFRDGIELRNVTFRYPKAKCDSLADVSLVIGRGECIGLIGGSGAGKSTLGMILAGLFAPGSGDVVVDGVSLSSREKLEAYRSCVGFVPQNPLLLPGTIADNIALSRWGEEHDMKRMAEVCSMAAMDFVLSGRKGFTFRIGEGGGGLSGGEAQRLSIARALYGNPGILVFDEATSSLDRRNEAAIEAELQALKGRLTIVLIAHRLTTVERCDRIVWLDKGRIREIGTPENVLPKYKA